MSRKRRRRGRSRPPGRVEESPAAEVQPAEDEPAEDRADDAAETEPRATRRGAQPSPFPPFVESMARGMRSVGMYPATLAAAFLSLLAVWAALVALGSTAGPGILAVTMSVSPSHLFSDVVVALGAGGSPLIGLVAVTGVVVLRAVTFGLILFLQVQALREERADVGAALRALPRLTLRLVPLYLFEMAVVVFALQLFTSFLGQLSILVLAAALYFLVFVPIVAVVEDTPAQESIRRALRAARLPGTRQLSLVLGYFLVLLYLPPLAPFGPIPPATPSVWVWAFALAATFLHVSVFGAFAYRWLKVRDVVPSGPAPRRRR